MVDRELGLYQGDAPAELNNPLDVLYRSTTEFMETRPMYSLKDKLKIEENKQLEKPKLVFPEEDRTDHPA